MPFYQHYWWAGESSVSNALKWSYASVFSLVFRPQKEHVHAQFSNNNTAITHRKCSNCGQDVMRTQVRSFWCPNRKLWKKFHVKFLFLNYSLLKFVFLSPRRFGGRCYSELLKSPLLLPNEFSCISFVLKNMHSCFMIFLALNSFRKRIAHVRLVIDFIAKILKFFWK